MSEDRHQALRAEACELNQALPRCGLVTMHSGNASTFDPDLGRLTPGSAAGADDGRARPLSGGGSGPGGA